MEPSPQPPPEPPRVPDNCLIVQCRESYRVEFEAEAPKVNEDGIQGYRVWLSLFDGIQFCSSAPIVVSSLDQWTIKGVAYGYAEGWDRG